MDSLFKKVMILATPLPMPPWAGKVFTKHPGPLVDPRSGGLKRLLKVIASAVILAILGVLFIVYNRHDDGMVTFGWFLVVVGAIIAVVFTILLVKGLATEPEPEPEAKPRRKRRK